MSINIGARMGVRISNGIAIGPSIGVQLAGGGASYDADALTLFAAMDVQPDSTRKQLISDTITALKSAGIWAKLDECWFMAAHYAQAGLLGWKRYKDLTAVNAPTFTADQGYAGNGTTSYLDTNYVPATHGVNYTRDDASVGIYCRTVVNVSVDDIGAQDGNNSNVINLSIRGGAGINTLFARINQHAAAVTTSNTDERSLIAMCRTADDAIQVYRNGSEFVTGTPASSGLPSYALYIGARNNGGTPINLSARQYAFAFVGGAMTEQQQGDLFSIVEGYMDAIGAGVVA